jgi:hypothetical protein
MFYILSFVHVAAATLQCTSEISQVQILGLCSINANTSLPNVSLNDNWVYTARLMHSGMCIWVYEV